ncbi:thiamine pyrophosphate-binding protein [Castellaniella sp.]|uniref:thiamine pyrophosphate-binding protein n=1 Tax=Castellaniella sp. TaxID=1955812 RepID=UPI002AFF10BE|nr:thiamine pyrophosphate-binding protein [Castellaniella sp.]
MTSAIKSAAVIAKRLAAHGVERVFALCGGHIMQIWMALADEGIEIVDVRDERSAVYMAHAAAAVSGKLGVALVTAGPGVTNAVTGIANAHMSRIPVLIVSGVPPMPQENRGALQDMSHIEIVRSITRYARTVHHAHAVPRELDAAIAAAQGFAGELGPSFIDFPVDVQRDLVPSALVTGPGSVVAARPLSEAPSQALDEAAALISNSERVLVIAGRGANPAAQALSRFLDVSQSAYLDTGETKGMIPDSHGSTIAAARGLAMKQADLVITIGRKLDFQLAFGSPAVFKDARFLRISDVAAELLDNRPGDVNLLGGVATALEGLSDRLAASGLAASRQWLGQMRAEHESRAKRLDASLAAAPEDALGRIHPNRLLSEIRQRLDPDAVLIADGGDFLSFARVALNSRTYLDPGPLGCIGLATPFALGAAKAAPGRQVVAVTGDGAFGFSAMEIDTVVRQKAPVMIVISNNGSWAIEVRDQMESFGKVVGTELQTADYAAMARAFGMKAWRVARHAEIGPALDEAFAVLEAGEPVLIDALTSPDAASSDSKSGLAWVPKYQALEAWDIAERDWLGVPD